MDGRITMLLTDGDPDREFRELLPELGPGWAGVDLTDREPALGLVRNINDEGVECWEFVTPDREAFWRRFGPPSARGPRLAFTTAPSEWVDLLAAEATPLRYRMRGVTIRRPTSAALGPLADTPAAARMIELVPSTIGPRDRRGPCGAIREGALPDGAALVLADPIVRPVDDRADRFLTEAGTGGAWPGALWLPPFAPRGAWAGVLDAPRAAARRALLRATAPAGGGGEGPTARVLLGLVDHPLVRALLAEGGGLVVRSGPAGETVLGLAAWPGPAPGTALSGWLLDPGAVAGPPWAAAVAAAFADDLRATGLEIEPADVPVRWVEPQVPPGPPGGPGRGLRDVLDAFVGRLVPASASPRRRLFLDPSAPPPSLAAGAARGRATGGDHDRAARGFLAHVARCPWSESAEPGGDGSAWRRYWLERVEGVDPDPSAPRRGARTPGRVEPGPPARLTLPAAAGDDDLMFARLALPPGAVVRREDVARLGDPGARLDRGLVLA